MQDLTLIRINALATFNTYIPYCIQVLHNSYIIEKYSSNTVEHMFTHHFNT